MTFVSIFNLILYTCIVWAGATAIHDMIRKRIESKTKKSKD